MDSKYQKSNAIGGPGLYIALVLIVQLFIMLQYFSIALSFVLSIPFLIPEMLSEYRPKYVAWAFVHRKAVASFVLASCTLLAMMSYVKYPYSVTLFQHPADNQALLQEICIGLGLGMMTRTLLTHLVYRMISPKDKDLSKILMLANYGALLVFMPLGYRYLLTPFFLFWGIGFYLHYLLRIPEHRTPRRSKMQKYLISVTPKLSKSGKYDLKGYEEVGILLYARHRWTKLSYHLKEYREQGSLILFFLEVSVCFRETDYDGALALLSEKEKQDPAAFKSCEHLFRLHRALNRFMKTRNDSFLRNADEIADDFIFSIQADPECISSNALYASKLADEILLGATNPTIQALNLKKGQSALLHINRALKNYDHRDKLPNPLSLIAGATIPCDYTFLLDIYGYVLFKTGSTQLAETQLTQSLYKCPSYADTYLHHAELLIEKAKRNSHGERLIKAAKLNLYIAICTERLDAKDGNDSKTAEMAKRILQTKISTGHCV